MSTSYTDVSAATPPTAAIATAVKLSKSKLHTLQAQLAHCIQQLSSPTTQPTPTLIPSLTILLSNLLTFHSELAPHTSSVPFELVATRLLPGVYDLLVSCLQQPHILHSTALPLVLQCVALFPLPLSSPGPLRLLCGVSGECVQRLASDLAHEQLESVCMSPAAVTARLSNLSSSSLLLFVLNVRQLLQTAEGGGSAVLILLLHCSYRLWAATDCGLPTDELSVCLRHTPSVAALPSVVVQLSAHSDRMAAYLALCEHKQWVDWTLFTLVLPSLYQQSGAPQLSADSRRQLLQLLAFYCSSSAVHSTAVYDWLDRVHRIATEQSSLPTLFSTLSAAGLLHTAPTPAVCLQLLLSCIPLYAPLKQDVSGYLSSLLSYSAPSRMTLPSLLYQLLSHITVFLSTAPHFTHPAVASVTATAVTTDAFVASVRSVSECWAHSLTCEASVPALKRQGVEVEQHDRRTREHTRHVLNELRQLAIGSTVR